MKLYKINKDHELILNIEENDNNICLYDDLKEQIIKKKSEIDKYNSKDWENSKKKLCKYENIYSSSSKRYKNICNIVPVSRSYFKLHEMIYDFNLLKNIDGSIFCCCIAEGPGGFIHCLNDFNKIINGKINKIYGITLISEDNTVPYWNISILKNNTNKIFLNDNNDGNIYNINIVNSFLEFVEEKCDLITSDGGFDYSNDYNKQELNSYRLLYCEIFTALNIQKQGGCFIIKIFDIFYYKTLQLIYLLYNLYNEVYIYKPSLSRLSNSEKYIICKGFNGFPDILKNKLTLYYNNCEKFYIDIPLSFINEIREYNHNYIKSQSMNILNIINHIKSKNLITKDNNLFSSQISNAIEWCNKYNLPINKNCIFIKNN